MGEAGRRAPRSVGFVVVVFQNEAYVYLLVGSNSRDPEMHVLGKCECMAMMETRGVRMCVCVCVAESARGGACCLTAVLLGGSRFSPCSTLLLLAWMINAGKGWNVESRPGIRIPLERPHLLHALAPASLPPLPRKEAGSSLWAPG